jgi:hypothetical protein
MCRRSAHSQVVPSSMKGGLERVHEEWCWTACLEPDCRTRAVQGWARSSGERLAEETAEPAEPGWVAPIQTKGHHQPMGGG